tara:strand:+ start:2199 stop:3236 length:1038 start_codon:yes stop_codon:yes gene_type:complete
MGRHIYEQLGSGYNCEVEATAPGGWKCVPNQIGAGQYPNIAACIDSPNGCKKWECQAQAKKKKKIRRVDIQEAIFSSSCVAVDDYSAPYTNPTDCNNSCSPDESWDCDGNGNCSDPGTGNGQYSSLINCEDACYTGEWWCEGNTTCKKNPQHWMSPTYPTKQDCQQSCGQEICCDVWVCVNGGKFKKCCKQVNLCKPPNAPFDTNYPGGFPWNLVESSGVPPKEFNRILKENLLLEWACNMSWSAHFGIWLGATKSECMAGPSWSGVGPASGQGGCGPCNATPNDIDKFKKDFDMDNNYAYKKDGKDKIKRWKEEGRVEPLNENFYKEIVDIVEDIYRTTNLLKG